MVSSEQKNFHFLRIIQVIFLLLIQIIIAINEDYDNDNKNSEDFEETCNDLLCDGTGNYEAFADFSSEDVEGSTDDDPTSSDEETIVNQQPSNRKKQATDSPDGWDVKH